MITDIRPHYLFLFSMMMKLPVNLNDNGWDGIHYADVNSQIELFASEKWLKDE